MVVGAVASVPGLSGSTWDYKLIHDCEKTLDADITDLFEREANVFTSEVLFQGDLFAEEAHGHDFGLKVPG